jgi:hypothetical protein
VRAQVRKSGGIGGFLQSVDVDTDALNDELRIRVEDTLASDRLAKAQGESGDPFAADMFQYEIVTVDGSFLVDGASEDSELVETLDGLVGGQLSQGSEPDTDDSPPS